MGVLKLNDIEYSGGSSANIDITTTLTEDTVSDTSVPSSKAVYNEINTSISDSLSGVKFIQKTYSGVETSVTLDCFPSDKYYFVLGNVGLTNTRERTPFETVAFGTKVEEVNSFGSSSTYLGLSIVDNQMVVTVNNVSNVDVHVQAICIPYFSY